MPDSEGRCIGCGKLPDFAAFIVLNTLRRSPRRGLNTKKIPVCKACCNPHSPNYPQVGKTLAAMIFGLHNHFTENKRAAANEA